MVTLATIPGEPNDRPDATAMAAWRALLRYHALATQTLDSELREEHGIPIEWYDVLVQLSEHGGRMRMSAVAEATLFSRANCTRIVDRMERKALVSREVDPQDHRGRIACLTPEGRRLLRSAARTHLRGIQHVFGEGITSSEARKMASVLDRLSPDQNGP
ncbi:MAG: MarR family winged helix-turn-helix transcriptional regulator [Microthrixaceae bacterium]